MKKFYKKAVKQKIWFLKDVVMRVCKKIHTEKDLGILSNTRRQCLLTGVCQSVPVCLKRISSNIIGL